MLLEIMRKMMWQMMRASVNVAVMITLWVCDNDGDNYKTRLMMRKNDDYDASP